MYDKYQLKQKKSEAFCNRLYNKTQNVRQGFNNEHEAWERALMFLGWSQYNLNLENKKMDEIKICFNFQTKIKFPPQKKSNIVII